MAAKRSRLGRSSSSGDTTVLSAPIFEPNEIFCPVSRPLRLAPSPAPAVAKPSPAKVRPSIFMISTSIGDPVEARSEGVSKLGGFLEKCCYCGKKIAEDDDVFMYSTLRAYCSSECREKQIEIDKDLEKLAAKPKLKGTGKRGL